MEEEEFPPDFEYEYDAVDENGANIEQAISDF